MLTVSFPSFFINLDFFVGAFGSQLPASKAVPFVDSRPLPQPGFSLACDSLKPCL
jgi:hypothetical protein